MRTVTQTLLLAAALLWGTSGVALAQPKLLIIGFDPPTQTGSNTGSAVIRFNTTNTTANKVDVTFFRDDGASTLVAGLTPTAGPFSVTVPLPRGVDGRRVTFTGVIQDTVTGQLAAGDKQLFINVDDTPPQPPQTITPPFPATVNTNVLTITGKVLRADGTPETSGTVIITRIDPPQAGSIIGAGAIRSDGNYTATADLTSFTTGVVGNIGFRAEDGVGNKSTTITRQVTKALVRNPTISNATIDPPGGTLTNNPAVLVRGSVTGTNGPFTVFFIVDGFIESQVSGLNSGESFAHTLTLASDGIHSISLRAQNSNTPPDSGTLVNLGQITLDRLAPAAPVIIDPNPVGPTPVVTSGGFLVRGFSGERSPSSTSPFNPVILVTGPQNVTLAPASPLAIDQQTGEFRTQVNVANLEDGQHRLTFATRDAAGNSGPASSVDVVFVKDTKAPILDEIRINGTIAPQNNPEIFVGQGTVAIQIKTSEDVVNVPRVELTQNGGSVLPAGISSGALRVFNYVYGSIPGFDGPVRVAASGARDRAGNALNQTVDRVFVVDTTPPQVTSITPKDATSTSVSPAFFRVTFVDPPSSAGTASGPDLVASRILIEGPLGSQSATIPGTQTPFDPFTLDFFPAQPLKKDGTYRIKILAIDKVGNRTENFTSTFILDTTPILATESNVLPNPKEGSCVNAQTFPGTAGAPFITVRLTDPQIDLGRTTVVVRDFCRIPPTISGTTEVVLPDTIKFKFTKPLATDGRDDGVYNIGVTLHDQAGNISPEFNRSFSYDTLIPSVQGTFPTTNAAVSGPLRAVDALLFDPRFDACRERCGIDRTASTSAITLSLIKPNPATSRRRNVALPFKIPGTLRFQSVGNVDKVLLELVGPDLATNGLLTDGTDDGVYQLDVAAIDAGGNRSPVTSATFIYDTLTPDIVVDNLKDGSFLTGAEFTLTGNTRDDLNGSGVDRVTVSLQSIDVDGNPTTSVPVFRDLLATLDPAPAGQTNTRRTFTFKGDIRSIQEPTFASLSVKSFDRAGNAREATFQVNLQTSALRPPELSSPPMKVTTANPIVVFSWLAVPGATNYNLRLIGPNQDQQTFLTDGKTSLSINLAPLSMGDGIYYWAVASVDPAGRQGIFSQNRQVVLDRERPRVAAVDIIDPSPEAVGVINAGEVRFTLKFTEPMDTRFPIAPRIVPQNRQAGFIDVSQTSYDGTIWTGRATIPENNDRGSDFNGLAELEILGQRDLRGTEAPPRDSAGNTLEAPPHALVVFEIDTGPFYRVSLFQNPIDRKDVILIVKGFVRDGGPPERLDESLSILVRRGSFANQSPAFIRINESTFRTTFRVDTASVQPVSLEITGRDRQGNSSTRAVVLNVTLLSPTGAAVVGTSDGVLQLKTAPEGVREETLILTPQATGSLLSGQTPDKDESRPQPELIPLGELEQFFPSGLAFSRQAVLTADLSKLAPTIAPALLAKAGIYVEQSGKWLPVSSRRDGSQLVAEVGSTGPYRLYADTQAPAIAAIEPPEGALLDTARPQVTARVTDGGSGIDPMACVVVLNAVAYPAAYDPATEQLTWSPTRALEPGSHDLSIETSDRAGNKSVQLTRLTAPPAFGFSEIVCYPNPARFTASIRYRLNQSADSVRIRVHDSAGRRIAAFDAPTTAGLQTADWPLISDDGEPVANGVYFVVAEARQAGRRTVEKLKLAVLR